MCGFCGTVGVREPDIDAMTDLLAHRGPDDRGTARRAGGDVHLGFRRLSIIDLSPGGHQPWETEDDAVAVVFNGEIYNYRELRRALEDDGVRFRSQSDTEVIVRLYERDGLDAVRALEGMFAIAIHDARGGEIHLIRDRLGIKPLYYAAVAGRVAFASEIKSVLASGVASEAIDDQALWDYFTYLFVPCPATIYRDIRQVPPGCIVTLDVEAGAAKEPEPYWRLSPEPSTVEAFRATLQAAVEQHLVSDVPLGLFLSGGIDSVILAGLMQRFSTDPIKTFTVVFEGAGLEAYDERALAGVAARRLGTEHTELPVRLEDPLALLSTVEGFDQPFGNPTSLLLRLISAAARPHVTVALNGAGGDELFAGYPRYRAMQLSERAAVMPAALPHAAGKALSFVPDSYRSMSLRRGKEFLLGWDRDPVERFVRWTYYADEPTKERLLTARGSRRSSEVVRAAWREAAGFSGGNRWLATDLATFLPDNILAYTDAMSMAESLEVRVPYLDHRVVEAAMGIPFGDKLQGGTTKVALKRAFADLLPTEILEGPKRGFNLPLARWIDSGALGTYLDRHLGPAAVADRGIFDADAIGSLRGDLRRGRADTSALLFAIIAFDVWDRVYQRGESLADLVP